MEFTPIKNILYRFLAPKYKQEKTTATVDEAVFWESLLHDICLAKMIKHFQVFADSLNLGK